MRERDENAYSLKVKYFGEDWLEWNIFEYIFLSIFQHSQEEYKDCEGGWCDNLLYKLKSLFDEQVKAICKGTQEGLLSKRVDQKRYHIEAAARLVEEIEQVQYYWKLKKELILNN